MLALPLIRQDDNSHFSPMDKVLVGLDSMITALMMQGTINDPEASQDEAKVRSWDVQGSKGNTYTVTHDGHVWGCSCPGFGWRRKCRHVTQKMHEMS